MTKRGKISAFQLFSILFLCRIIALFTFIIPSKYEINSGDKSIEPFVFLAMSLLAVIPVFLIIGKNENEGIVSRSKQISPLFGKIISVFYAAVFLWTAAVNVSRFEFFVSTVMFPDADITVLAVILLVAAVIAALKGPEAIGRASVIIVFLLLASFLFIFVSVFNEYDVINLDSPLYNGMSPLLDGAFSATVRTMELVSLLAAAPFTNGNIKKGTVKWLILFSVFAAFIFNIIYGVSGIFGKQQMFQLYTITVLARFGIFERMDDAIIGIWVLCAFIKSAYYILIAVKSTEEGFSFKADKKIYIFFSAIIMLIYLIIARSITQFTEIMGHAAIDILFISAVFIVPLLVFFLYKHKTQSKGALLQ